MFGPKFRIEYDGLGISLVPFKKEWTTEMADLMSSHDVHLYTMQTRGFTSEDEQDWFDRTREDKSIYVWGILPDGEDTPVGITNIHGIFFTHNSCGSGITIYKKEWWGKGVASRSHLIRTWFAADVLNRFVISSEVRVPNIASRKALERIGYITSGIQLRDGYRDGKFFDTYVLSWLNPERINLLYPEGIKDKGKKFHCGIERAQAALNKARKMVVKL
jgi:RimJ/RimL family protein N-acetyltransferase